MSVGSPCAGRAFSGGLDVHTTLDLEMQEAARELVDAGACEVVALTMAAAGALVVSADGALRLPPAAIKVQSTVGAGDSFLGGFVLRLAQGKDETMLYTTSRLGRSTGIATAQYRARQLPGRKTLSDSGLALKMISRQICHDCRVKQASASCLIT